MADFVLHPRLARDCFVITDLSLCRLLLMNDKNYPWCILVPMRGSPDNYKREIYELSETDQVLLIQESARLAKTMMQLSVGKKMNVAALGNMVPQLHIHHIVRFENDPCWPKPVWGQVAPVFYSAAEAQTLMDRIRAAL